MQFFLDIHFNVLHARIKDFFSFISLLRLWVFINHITLITFPGKAKMVLIYMYIILSIEIFRQTTLPGRMLQELVGSTKIYQKKMEGNLINLT